MTELNGSRPSLPIDNPRGVILSSRQLTLTISPPSYAMLKDLARVNNVSEHDAATSLLEQVIQMTHDNLKRAKIIYSLTQWITWGDAKLGPIRRV